MKTHEEISRLIGREQAAYARCLDDENGVNWHKFFDEECFYLITTADNFAQGLEAGSIYADSQGMLQDRIAALRDANIYERHRYRHIIGLPNILQTEEQFVWSETNFLVVRTMRTGETVIFATGKYLDCHRLTENGVRIRERKVICDSNHVDTLLAMPL